MDLSALEQSFRGGGANPPLLGLLMRPLPDERHTYRNIRRTGCFTVNHVTEGILRKAHQTSARYPEEVSEFDACGLTPEFLGIHTAPYVNEATIKIGAAYRGEDEIAAKRRGKKNRFERDHVFHICRRRQRIMDARSHRGGAGDVRSEALWS